MHTKPVAFAALAAFTLAGCVTVRAPDGTASNDDAALCNAESAQTLVGQTASSETGARALALSRARSLRWGPPDSAWTMDFRGDRVNVRYDAAMTITAITCG